MAVFEARTPIFSLIGCTSKPPDQPFSTAKAEIAPPWASRAMTKKTSADGPLVIQYFEPLKT
jgi:hypothetical protein